MFVLFAFLGFFMFGLRRKQRKTMEARWKSNDDASNPS
jgi:preprotein translocase subunit YajC